MNLSADFVIVAIQLLLAKGMDLPEAVSSFSREQLSHAMFDDEGMSERQRELLNICAKASMEESNGAALTKAIELWGAGWIHEPHDHSDRIMAWYWRAPAKGNRPKGRRYLSTNQAFNALQKCSNR